MYVGVWEMVRWGGRSHNKLAKAAWVQRHCQCIVVVNINALCEKTIHYRIKNGNDASQRRVLRPQMDGIERLENYLWNFECVKNGFSVLQNQFPYVSQVVAIPSKV